MKKAAVVKGVKAVLNALIFGVWGAGACLAYLRSDGLVDLAATDRMETELYMAFFSLVALRLLAFIIGRRVLGWTPKA